uniref:uncharacterized protein LOC112435144 n=1 Tax=Maylandia zebra TaxID=106582 RepID=UPI000D3033E6|nr:uncharacterized protein LOC112435144 [Maylandia zebra]
MERRTDAGADLTEQQQLALSPTHTRSASRGERAGTHGTLTGSARRSERRKTSSSKLCSRPRAAPRLLTVASPEGAHLRADTAPCSSRSAEGGAPGQKEQVSTAARASSSSCTLLKAGRSNQARISSIHAHTVSEGLVFSGFFKADKHLLRSSAPPLPVQKQFSLDVCSRSEEVRVITGRHAAKSQPANSPVAARTHRRLKRRSCSSCCCRSGAPRLGHGPGLPPVFRHLFKSPFCSFCPPPPPPLPTHPPRSMRES